jgi:hypothetical protein
MSASEERRDGDAEVHGPMWFDDTSSSTYADAQMYTDDNGRVSNPSTGSVILTHGTPGYTLQQMTWGI